MNENKKDIAHVEKMTVAVQVVRVGTKAMTLAVFHQIRWGKETAESKLWGIVEKDAKKYLLFSDNGNLFRRVITFEPPYWLTEKFFPEAIAEINTQLKKDQDALCEWPPRKRTEEEREVMRQEAQAKWRESKQKALDSDEAVRKEKKLVAGLPQLFIAV